jgi:hypothetical protein
MAHLTKHLLRTAAVSPLLVGSVFVAEAQAQLEVTVCGLPPFEAPSYQDSGDFHSESDLEVRSSGVADNGLEITFSASGTADNGLEYGFGDIKVDSPLSGPDEDSFDYVSPFAGADLSVCPGAIPMILGVRARVYVGEGGEVEFDLHPTAGIDTFVSFDPNFSISPYVGFPFLIRFDPRYGRTVVTPWLGIDIKQSTIKLFTDESGGGGTANEFEEDDVSVGFSAGLNVDVPLPLNVGADLQPFLRIGGAVHVGHESEGGGTSAILGNDYSFSAEETSVEGRIGMGLAF